MVHMRAFESNNSQQKMKDFQFSFTMPTIQKQTKTQQKQKSMPIFLMNRDANIFNNIFAK